MNMKPLHDKVVIERAEKAEKSVGGIYIPDGAQEKPQEGTVVACGPGGRTDSGELIPMSVKPGDRVLFAKYGAQDIKHEGRDYLIVGEASLYATLDEQTG